MKKLLIIVGVVLAIAIPLVAFAATSNAPAAQAIRGFCGIDTSKLTVQQKADITDQFNKMMDLRKESINKMVANGSITKEQGDAAIKQIDDAIKNGQGNGFAGGCGIGQSIGGGCGMSRGCGGNGCPGLTNPTQ